MQAPSDMHPGPRSHARRALFAAALALCVASPARADTSYLRPNIFNAAKAERVTAIASFTEDFANPNVAVDSAAWTIVGPDGSTSPPDRLEKLSQVTVLEEALAGAGTWRLSTGERLGRKGQQVLVDGVWTPWAPGRAIPPGAETRASQTATIADVYVTIGAPTRAPIEAALGRLELRPVTHPADAYRDIGFEFRVLLDGKPVTGQPVEIWRDGGNYDEPKFRQVLTSGTDGGVKASFNRPGVYLIWTRLSAEAPKGSATPIRSYTTSLTLEVQP